MSIKNAYERGVATAQQTFKVSGLLSGAAKGLEGAIEHQGNAAKMVGHGLRGMMQYDPQVAARGKSLALHGGAALLPTLALGGLGAYQYMHRNDPPQPEAPQGQPMISSW